MASAKKKITPKKKKGSLKARKAADAKRLADKKKKATQAEAKAKHTAALTKLNPVAKEINVRLSKAAKLEGDANDHRLAASLKAAEAKALCEKEKLPWKKWVEGNLKHSYETVRKLAVIGASDNPEEALLATREKNRAANVTHRETRRVTQQTAAADAKITPFQAATKAIDALEDKPVLNLIESAAHSRGMAVVSKTDQKDLKAFRKQKDEGPGTKAVIAAFDALKPSQQMKVAEHAAAKVGCKLDKPTFDPDPKRPDFLDRGGKAPGKRVRRGAKK